MDSLGKFQDGKNKKTTANNSRKRAEKANEQHEHTEPNKQVSRSIRTEQ